jgi:GNAT superfamily N-acetyltransferase
MATASPRYHDDIRTIDADDLEFVVAIDRAHTGHSRRRFFEKRFAQAAAHPDDFVQIGMVQDGSLRGFALAHLLRGEFGREDIVAVLDVLGVEFASQDRGIGQALIERLIEILRQKRVRSLHSQTSWTNHDLLRFFDSCGFSLSPRTVLERSIAPLIEPAEELL